jgi:hypothetical protein
MTCTSAPLFSLSLFALSRMYSLDAARDADELLTAPESLDADEKASQHDKGARRRAHRPTTPILFSSVSTSLTKNAPSPTHPRIAELVEEMLGALREEVKEMDRTNWLYETQDPQVSLRIVV